VSQWGESKLLCAYCDKGAVQTAGDVCSDCIRGGLEAVEGYLGKQAAFAAYLREHEKAPPCDGA